MSFELTEKQTEAMKTLASNATYLMLFGGSRCVAADTIIDGQTKTIKQLALEGKPVRVLTSRGEQWAEVPFLKGTSRMTTFELESGKSVTVTDDHRFWDGFQWIKAKDCLVGSSLAVRLCEKNPLQSNQEFFLSRFREDVRRLKKRLSNCRDGYSLCHRQYDQQPHQGVGSDPIYRALQFDEPGHIPPDQYRQFRALKSLVSNTHVGYLSKLFEGCNRFCHKLFRFANKGDFPSTCPLSLFRSHEPLQICEQFRGLRLVRRLFDQLSILQQFVAEQADICVFRFFRCVGLSWDRPLKSGYCLERVVKISSTAEQEYYTLHVPSSEQYFANGILHHNSGKTFLHVRNIVFRALKAPGSRHCILRFRFNHLVSSIIEGTFPRVMEIAFPGVEYKMNRSAWYVRFENGSEIWFGGLDDKARTEKILGNEYATIYLNECSQISWESVGIVFTRLAQLIDQQIQGAPNKTLKTRLYFDCNPPSKLHWSYSLFHKKIDHETKEPLKFPADYASVQMNPQDNEKNLSPEYIQTLKNLPARLQKRFLTGEYTDANPNALFDDINFDCWRVTDGLSVDLIRVVVAVDPSGASDGDENAGNDAIGIVVVGLGSDGNAYLLEDCTTVGGPAIWGSVVAQAYDRQEADIVVAEVNYGGGMVQSVVRAARPNTPFAPVRASRGKHIRADPVSILYSQGKVRHVGNFPELEEELCGFSATGYLGDKSPNRADALVWAITYLFPTITKKRDNKIVAEPPKTINHFGRR